MSAQEKITVCGHVNSAATVTFGLCHGQSGEYKLEGITLVPSAAIAESGSNKFVIAITQGSDTVATSYDTSSSGNALTAGTAKALTITSTAGSALEFGATDVLKFVATLTGSAQLTAQVVATFSKVRV